MSEALRMLPKEEPDWYKEGLRFKCTGCGECCTGSPGYVWVNPEEVERMAQLLKIDISAFKEKYLRREGDRYSLKEDPHSYACVFLDGKNCRIYSERPTQCRTYPWWPQILQSSHSWEREAEYCEGIQHAEAETVEHSKIREQLNTHKLHSPMR